MNLSMKWLSEFVTLDPMSPREFAEAMTMSGSKVEGWEIEGEKLDKVVVGQVLSIEKHPDADKLVVCQVDADGEAPIQIVTGASNLTAGDKVPVALDGSTLVNGTKIKKGKLRGVESCGMMCSLGELGLTAHDFPYAIEDGIFVLQEECELGQDIRSVIGLNDTGVEFEITSNRPDCFSVIGLAREAAATFDKELKLHTPVVKAGHGDCAGLLDVKIEAPDLCPIYSARIVKNVRVKPSPRWLRERLRVMGVRPINNIVDITNYVMLEYGQPMHAFDYRYVKGGRIIVRRAKDGETLTTLDGTPRKLNPSMLVIADAHRAVGLAGIMGGENSEIVDDTVDVVFESANFDGTCIRKGALALGMRTEASAKFEKGLDPMNTLPAVNRACELVELLGAGEVVDGVIDILNHVPQPTVLELEPEKINDLLGTDVSGEEMASILRKLDFQVEGDRITVPSWRGDVLTMADLAEEVARFHGYNRIPVTLMRGTTTQGGYSPAQRLERHLGQTCRSAGYDEIITYSFISPTYYDKIGWAPEDPRRRSLKILNPLGEDTSIMRTTTLPSMLEILARNYNFRNKSARLYELGRIYLPRADGLADEPKVLSLGAYGDIDFFGLKGVVEALLHSIRVGGVSYQACRDNASYHPGRCATVCVGGEQIGVLGQIHPTVCANYGVDTALYCAELSFEALMRFQGPEREYVPLPKFPSVARDIAVVCDASIPVATLENCISRGARGLLKEVELFDIYTGAPIPAGKKSVAFNLTLRSDERSLTAAEADEDVKSVLELLQKELGAVLR